MFHIISISHVVQSADKSKVHPTALQIIQDNQETVLKHLDPTNFANIYLQANEVDALLTKECANVNQRANEIARTLCTTLAVSYTHLTLPTTPYV